MPGWQKLDILEEKVKFLKIDIIKNDILNCTGQVLLVTISVKIAGGFTQ